MREASFKVDGLTIFFCLAIVAVVTGSAIASCHKRDVARACVAAGSSWDGRECRVGAK